MKKKNPFTLIHDYKTSYIRHYVADFETCKTEDGTDVRTWAWGMANIFDYNEFEHGTNIDVFLNRLLADKNIYDIGIHNLKFDGNFILPALFKRGYKYVNDKTFLDMFLKGEDLSNVFTHNITSMGQWFNIIVGKPKRASKSTPAFIYFWDTLKLFPMTLKEVGTQYNKQYFKLEEGADFYDTVRPQNHALTGEELDYLRLDCLTLAEALRGQFERYGRIYRTRASKAFKFFKDCCNGDDNKSNLYSLKYEGVKQLKLPLIKGLEEYEGVHFRDVPLSVKNQIKALNIKITPHIDYYIPNYYTWLDLKQSYRGGISYVNPYYTETSINQKILVLDVNSMYPYCLRTFKMPYGKFTYHKGAPAEVANTTWIACARVSFRLKNDYNLPCIQIKDKYGREWLRESTDYRTKGRASAYNEDIITFTAVDYETYLENYDFVVHEWIFHYRFNLFSNLDGQRFVDRYYAQKVEADKKIKEIKKQYPTTYKNNPDFIKASLERQEAKIILNSAYGKMGTKYVLLSKNSRYIEGEPIEFIPEHEQFNKEPDDPSHYYLPYASFVTSYARQMLVRAWRTFKGKAVYCDTDSIHAICTREELPSELLPFIDFEESGELGKWKIEGEFIKGRYIRAKTYVEVDADNKAHITCAGAPTQVKKLMTWDNFRTGFNAWEECDKRDLKRKEYSKLIPKRYPSGVDLVPTNFEIL